jgi:polyisoprenyl-phosphate glycosyltransferase
MAPTPDISVVVPVHNEDGNLMVLHQRLGAVLQGLGLTYELLFVNDGSQDRSMVLIRELAAKDPRVRFLDLSRNFGHQIAVTAGLDHSRGKAVVIIDADLQDPPELIADLYRRHKEGFEVVYARRRQRKGEGFLKKWTARMFYRLLRRLTKIDIPLDTGDFRIIDRKVVNVLKQMPEQNKFLRGQISWAGFRQTSVEYDRDERHSGRTSYTYSKMIRFALDGITAFSEVPLRFITVMGFLVSGIAFLLIVYAVLSYFLSPGYQAGWASQMVSFLFIGGIQLIGIGIIGEYLARIGANVRQRPLYIVAEDNLEEEQEKKPRQSEAS